MTHYEAVLFEFYFQGFTLFDVLTQSLEWKARRRNATLTT